MKYQFFIVSLALLVRSVVPQNGGGGNCHAPCHEVCDGTAPGRICRPVGSGKIKEYFVDPWMCAEPRCQQVQCRDCGNTTHCIDVCEQFRLDNEIDGPYPQCRQQCRDVKTRMKCFQRCTRLPENFPVPPCDFYECSETYCNVNGRQICNARKILIDPIPGTEIRGKAKCPQLSCSKCGDHAHCIGHCERYNQYHGTAYDCEAVCGEVEGYKCINMPPEDYRRG